MHFAFYLLLGLISACWIFLFGDTLLVQGLLGAYVALVIITIAISIRPGEAAFFKELIGSAFLVALVPVLWMVLQTLPLSIKGIQHPIWQSTQAALTKAVLGSVSISPGATLIACARYCSALGLLCAVTALAIDRSRAEHLLLWLAGTTTLLAMVLIAHDLGGFVFLGQIDSVGRHAAISDAASLGTILTAAAAMYAFERFTAGHSIDFGRYIFMTIIVLTICASAVCWIATLFFTSTPNIFAAACGFGAFLLIVTIRRVGLTTRTCFVVFILSLAVPLSLVIPKLMTKAPDLTLRFNTTSAPQTLSLTQRVITDTPWLGSGAGTFTALRAIYEDTPNLSAPPIAPTTAAAMTIGLGRGGFYLMTLGAALVIVWLAAGAFQRGRDSFFPAAAASCCIILLLKTFADASLSSSTIIVIAASTLGLGLAQRLGRSSRTSS